MNVSVTMYNRIVWLSDAMYYAFRYNFTKQYAKASRIKRLANFIKQTDLFVAHKAKIFDSNIIS